MKQDQHLSMRQSNNEHIMQNDNGMHQNGGETIGTDISSDQKVPDIELSEIRGVMETYTCPMHPEVKSDKPGKCPKCGMELVKKK